MWALKLKGGIELTEKELEYWDRVPADAEIEALALIQPRGGKKMFVHDFRGYEEYCCARMGVGPIPVLIQTGYCLYLSIHGQVTEIEFLDDGMRVKSYPREKSDVPDRCWRRGVS